MDMKVSFLYLGRMEFPLFRLVETPDETKMVRSPAVAILIQHPTLGNILYDTGNSPAFATEYTDAMLHDYPVAELVTITQALAQKGLSPSDIDQIILSHLHFDHAGGLKQFEGTKAIKNVLVSEADLKQAYFSVMTGNGGAYIRSLFDVEGIQFKTINQDTKLADGVELFIQEAHTPGVIGLILKTKHNGTLITTRRHHQQDPGGVLHQPQAHQGDGEGLQRHPHLRPRLRPVPGLGGQGLDRLSPIRQNPQDFERSVSLWQHPPQAQP